MTSKIPPQNIGAEQVILGGVLLSNDHFSELIVEFPPESFYREAHQYIFQSMIDLYKEDKEIDLITLGNQLEKNNVMDKSGGMDYLTDLATNTTFTSASWKHHKQIILDLYKKRKTITVCSSICEQLFSSWMSNDEALNILDNHVIENMNLFGNKSDLTPVEEIIEGSFRDMEAASLSDDGITGLNTGYMDLNNYTQGLQDSDLIILAARPSMGKSSLALNLAYNIAKNDKVVAIFDLETSKRKTVNRLISMSAKIDSKKIKTGRLRDSDWTQITQTAGELMPLSIYIDDSSAIGLTEMRSKLKTLLKKVGKLDLIMVDYLQMISGSKKETREREIAEYSIGLKALAKDFDVPLIALSQLNRKVEDRPNKRPQTADLRDSGSLEQDGDMILFIYRDEVYHGTTDENRNLAEIIIAKQRDGETGSFKMTFLKEYTLFKDYIHDVDYEYNWQDRKDYI